VSGSTSGWDFWVLWGAVVTAVGGTTALLMRLYDRIIKSGGAAADAKRTDHEHDQHLADLETRMRAVEKTTAEIGNDIARIREHLDNRGRAGGYG